LHSNSYKSFFLGAAQKQTTHLEDAQERQTIESAATQFNLVWFLVSQRRAMIYITEITAWMRLKKLIRDTKFW
jgi:hypothetical protein